MTSAYFIGICGTAMATLAAMLKRRGLRVRGSDANAYPPMDRFLAEQGIAPYLGYDADHLTGDIDIVVNRQCRIARQSGSGGGPCTADAVRLVAGDGARAVSLERAAPSSWRERTARPRRRR